MRPLPTGYRTASPDGKIITVYFGEEKLGVVKAKGTEREELLAAEEQAVVACEKHAEGVASGKVKPAAAAKAESREVAQLKAQVLALSGEIDTLAAANKLAAEELATATARIAELEQQLADQPK